MTTEPSKRKPIYEWLFRKMQLYAAKQPGLELQPLDTWAHSLQVWAVASKMIVQLKNTYIDIDFVEFACFAHDIGRMVTGSKASTEKTEFHGFAHGPLGAVLVRRSDFFDGLDDKSPFGRSRHDLQKATARVCERHTGCVGMSDKNWPKELLGLGGMVVSYTPDTWDTLGKEKGCFVGSMEERIVGMADFLTKARSIHPEEKQHVFYKGSAQHIDKCLEEAASWDTIDAINEVKADFDKRGIDWDKLVGI